MFIAALTISKGHQIRGQLKAHEQTTGSSEVAPGSMPSTEKESK